MFKPLKLRGADLGLHLPPFKKQLEVFMLFCIKAKAVGHNKTILVYLKINRVIMLFVVVVAVVFLLLTFQSSLQGAAYYIRRVKLIQKHRTKPEAEWRSKSGSNISYLNIASHFLSFHTGSL